MTETRIPDTHLVVPLLQAGVIALMKELDPLHHFYFRYENNKMVFDYNYTLHPQDFIDSGGSGTIESPREFVIPAVQSLGARALHRGAQTARWVLRARYLTQYEVPGFSFACMPGPGFADTFCRPGDNNAGLGMQNFQANGFTVQTEHEGRVLQLTQEDPHNWTRTARSSGPAAVIYTGSYHKIGNPSRIVYIRVTLKDKSQERAERRAADGEAYIARARASGSSARVTAM